MNMQQGNWAIDHTQSLKDRSVIYRHSEWLGYAGLIPFVTLAGLCLLLQGDAQQYAGRALVSYGAVIIAFLGATHWGAVINGVNTLNATSRMLFAILPALLGWVAMLLPQATGLFVILVSLGAIYYVDRRWGGLHDRYITLRRRLTLVASISVALVLVFTYRSILHV